MRSSCSEILVKGEYLSKMSENRVDSGERDPSTLGRFLLNGCQVRSMEYKIKTDSSV